MVSNPTVGLPGRRAVLNVVGFALLIVLVAPFVVYAVPQMVGASHSYVVLSDSMSPTMQAGDVAFVREVSPAQIHVRDVITFERGSGADARTVTHRVVEVVREDGTLHFRTKGDANEGPDRELVPAAAVVGRVAFRVPKIGYVIMFAKTEVGIAALVIVPSVLLALSEAWTLLEAASASRSSETEDVDLDEWIRDETEDLDLDDEWIWGDHVGEETVTDSGEPAWKRAVDQPRTRARRRN